MTTEQINEACAELMGWEVFEFTPEGSARQTELLPKLKSMGIQSYDMYYIKADTCQKMEIVDWDPCGDLNQAWEVVHQVMRTIYCKDHRAPYLEVYAEPYGHGEVKLLDRTDDGFCFAENISGEVSFPLAIVIVTLKAAASHVEVNT